MKLQLLKPIAFFDIESTSAKPLTARIIELAIIKIYPDGTRSENVFLINPGEPIPVESTAIHGFTDDMVKGQPLFKASAPAIAQLLAGCDFGGFNSNQFDIPLLNAEFERADIPFNFDGIEFVDIGVLFKIIAPRTLGAAVLQYLGKPLDGAHGALADISATIEVLDAMLDKHGADIPTNVPDLAFKTNYDKRRLDLAGKFVYNDMGVEVFTFGAHKDEPLVKNQDYLKWMLNAKQKEDSTKFSFSKDTRDVIKKYLAGGYTTTSIENAPAISSTYKRR